MNKKQRYERLRRFTKQLNKERKRQAKQIDILCNDIMSAQREFVDRLGTICFAANFYRSIVGISDSSSLFYVAGKLIKEQLPEASIAIFLRLDENFELHLFEDEKPTTLAKQHLEDYFNTELVDSICKSNKLCALENLLEMGLQVKPNLLNKLSAITIPLAQQGWALGFILIYQWSGNQLVPEQFNNICSVTDGLSRAIARCCVPSHSND